MSELTPTDFAPPRTAGVASTALIVGAVGAALTAVGAFTNPDTFYRAYLWAWLFWTNIAIGSLVLLMIQHLSGGAWGVVVRRVLEASTRTLLCMGLLCLPIAVPIALGKSHLD